VLVDTFTIVAQIFNFLVLLFLLRRFLYRPIIDAMEQRQARIVALEETATTARAEAEAEATHYRELAAEFERERDAKLAQATEEAETVRKTEIRKARAEVEELRQRWRQALEQEQGEYLQELRRRIVAQVNEIASRALQDLAGAELETRMVDRLLDKLHESDAALHQEMRQAVARSAAEVSVMSAHELPADSRQRIQSAVREVSDRNTTVRFETSPDLLMGIEIRAQGYKLAWTLDAYLESLAEELFWATDRRDEDEQSARELSATEAPIR
jgi:F-type H+-transporting ATPase subunit b